MYCLSDVTPLSIFSIKNIYMHTVTSSLFDALKLMIKRVINVEFFVIVVYYTVGSLVYIIGIYISSKESIMVPTFGKIIKISFNRSKIYSNISWHDWYHRI